MKISKDEITSLYEEDNMVEHTFPTTPPHTATHFWQHGSSLLDITRACASLFKRLQSEGLLVPLRMGGNILDLGTGIVAMSLALINIPVCINGMDITLIQGFPLPEAHTYRSVNVQLVHQNVCHVPLPTAQFDLVVGSLRSITIHKQVPALTELIRVLRPGALLMILVKDFDTLFWPKVNWLPPEQVIDTMQQLGLNHVKICHLSNSALEGQGEVACLGIKSTP